MFVASQFFSWVFFLLGAASRAEVDDDARAAALRALDALLDRVRQVGPARPQRADSICTSRVFGCTPHEKVSRFYKGVSDSNTTESVSGESFSKTAYLSSQRSSKARNP